MQFDEADERYLKQALEQGEVILVLGAGVSSASRNRQGEPVKLGGALAEMIATQAGLPYNGENLPIVLSAAKPMIGDSKLTTLYNSEFSDIDPGPDIKSIGDYTWKRIYTWSIDDALNNGLAGRTQRLRFYNGLSDSVVESDNILNLQVIKLHGDILNPARGFVMTEADYAALLAGGSHHWYRKAAQDYLSHTPVFIGSRLAEPIFFAEIERAKRSPSEESGRGFIITPDTLSPIEEYAFKAKGLVHVSGTLADFIEWLSSVFPNGYSPRDVLAKTHSFSTRDLENKIDNSDIEAVGALYPRYMDQIYARALALTASEKNQEARRFLRGFPPTWEIAASDVPVWLTPTGGLYEQISQAIENRQRMIVVTGQSGSGKSTAVMQCLVKYGREHKDVPIYELRAEVKSVRSALNVLRKLHDVPIVIYLADVFVFGDQLEEDINGFDRGRFTVIATARTGEWNEHLERRFGEVSIRREYSRFTRSDYQPLIDRLIKYVPAPSFKALNVADRLSRLSQSREQLLIALREATFSQNFNDIITNEYERLPDDDTKRLLVIVGLATVARVGIDPGTAREAYKGVAKSRSFEDAESALQGIVSRLPSGRLFARHELYIRHIIDDVVSLDMLIDCLVAISGTYTKYPVPVVRNVNKVQGTLFRFCWNHKFVYEQCKRRDRLHDGERLYSGFEIAFQLDGHFWLQYGLYLKECGRFDPALTMLERSIEAYPDNPFAVHALAELQLIVALIRVHHDSIARRLVTDAVELLEKLDARNDQDIDQYPLVTLANLHVGVLVHHKNEADAKKFAKVYFERLQQMEKRNSSSRVTGAKERLLKYVTLNEWELWRQGSNGEDLKREPVKARRRRRRPVRPRQGIEGRRDP